MTKATASAKTEMKEAYFSVSQETGLITATIGDAKIEVSADGKKVTAYTKDGVETKAVTASVATEEGTKISLSKDFNAVVLNGVTIEQAADGHLVITAPGGTVINKPAPANDTAIAAAKAALEVGQLTAEGIYIGRLKDKSGVEKDYFASPTDAQDGNGKRLSLNFNKAAEYAKNSNALGHNDWTVPTGWSDKSGAPDVLNAMFNNKSTGAFKGTFDETGSYPSGWYWSSSPNYSIGYAEIQRLSDGGQDSGGKSHGLSVRLVRSLTI